MEELYLMEYSPLTMSAVASIATAMAAVWSLKVCREAYQYLRT
jgi:hypothetical protein